MKKKSFLFKAVAAVAVLAVIVIAAVSLQSKKADGSSSIGEKKIIRVSHGQPENHPDQKAMEKFKEIIEDKLGDKYEVEIYANGLLGDSKNALELAQTGAIDFVVSSTANLETFNKGYGLFSLPYLFVNEKAYFDYLDSDTSKKLYDSTENAGIKTVTWFDAGSRSFYGSKKIEKPSDLKGMKIRVQPSPLNVKMMEALGSGAMPMAFGEVYTAIQQGTIDGAENNELALTTVKHGEVSKYYSYDEHQRQPDILVASVRFLDSLSKEEKAIFDEAIEAAHDVELVEWKKATEEAIAESKKMGVNFVEVDKKPFQDKVLSIHKDYLKENPELQVYYDAILKANAANEK